MAFWSRIKLLSRRQKKTLGHEAKSMQYTLTYLPARQLVEYLEEQLFRETGQFDHVCG
jgi:hypothetical protein